MMKVLAALAALGLVTPGIAAAQSINGVTVESWNKAVAEYDASSRIQFKADWAKQIISALRDWEAGK